MTGFCASAQPIAAALADVDGTLVTRPKVVTTRAIEAKRCPVVRHRSGRAARKTGGQDELVTTAETGWHTCQHRGR